MLCSITTLKIQMAKIRNKRIFKRARSVLRAPVERVLTSDSSTAVPVGYRQNTPFMRVAFKEGLYDGTDKYKPEPVKPIYKPEPTQDTQQPKPEQQKASDQAETPKSIETSKKKENKDTFFRRTSTFAKRFAASSITGSVGALANTGVNIATAMPFVGGIAGSTLGKISEFGINELDKGLSKIFG